MTITGLLSGTHTLLVGVEDQDDGGLRMYLGHRSKGLYVIVDDPEGQRRIREAWAGGGGHITVPVPDGQCVYSESQEL